MFANKRQSKIYEILQRDGAVTTSKLFKEFDVSTETIRRDLLALEQQGKLIRVHGGAVARGEMNRTPPLHQRKKEFNARKHELSLKAIEFVNEGDTIAIGAGSTPMFFAEALKEHFSRLTIVTYSLDVFNCLCEHEDFSMILCGGDYWRQESSFRGDFTTEMLSKIHVKKLFLFPSAISLDSGIYTFHRDFYSIFRTLLRCADEVFVLADSSKFEKKALLKVDEMNSDYCYITDSLLSESLVELYKENDKKVFIGGMEAKK